MRKQLNLLLILLIFFQYCSNPQVVEISILGESEQYDTLFIQELITKELIGKIPLQSHQKKFYFPVKQSVLAGIQVKGKETSYLTILEPGALREISFSDDKFFTQNSTPDSIVNYLWHSTDEMFSKYGQLIFGDYEPEIVKEKFDSLIYERGKLISKNSAKATVGELAILNYQNQSRAFNFLMYYGRIVKELSAKDPFFDFVKKIPEYGVEAESLPDMILFKYEIETIRNHDSIPDIPSFLNEIEHKTEDGDLENFLKAYYIQSVIENPTYWRPHEHLFTTDKITEGLELEKSNPYSFLINRASDSFFSSMAGVEAFNFKAKKADDSDFFLHELKGKLILIDAWATWCGPCVKHRPNILKIAEKYQYDPRVQILTVSVDSEIDRWKNFVSTSNPNGYGIEVNIPDGMNDVFGDKYLVKLIPKYFLISPNGNIISSDLPEPSLGMEKMIEAALEKM